jgi:signal peptide peptidase SppA
VLPLYGLITQKRSAWSEFFGGTSTEQFAAMFRALLADSSVKKIVIEIDSPGGEANGTFELAEEVYKARKIKPIIASVNSLAASGAYWIASAAHEIRCTPTGYVGSIGVYTMHTNYEKAYEKAGVETTLISAAPYKTEGNPFEPLSEEAKAAVQKEVDHFYQMFLAAIGKHRGCGPLAVADKYGKGRVLNAQDALKAGMIDRIESFETTFHGVTAGKNRASSDWKTELDLLALEMEFW